MSTQTLAKTVISTTSPITEMTSLDFSQAVDVNNLTLPEHLNPLKYRFFKIKEIPEEKSSQYRLAMANVLSGLQKPDQSLVYVLSGTPKGVNLYLGVAIETSKEDTIHNEGESLKTTFEGNFLGAQVEQVKKQHIQELKMGRYLGFISGIPSFNEDESATGGEDVQGIERLVNSLLGKTWQLVIVSQAISATEIKKQINQLYELSTELSQHIKLSVQQSENTGWNETKTKGTSTSDTKGISTSKTEGTSDSKTTGTNEGKTKTDGTSSGSSSSGKSNSIATTGGTSTSDTKGTSTSDTTGENVSKTTGETDSHTVGYSGGDSLSLSRDRMNKQVESLHEYINETLLGRYYLGQTKGLFKTAIYVSADTPAVYNRLANGVISLFQGNQVSMVPMQVHKLEEQENRPITSLLTFKQIEARKSDPYWQENALLQGIPIQSANKQLLAATAITTRELTLVAGMPSIELPGLKIRKSVDFAVNVPETNDEDKLSLGGIIQHGRDLSQINKLLNEYQVSLNKKELNKHTFICGVTGSGKTTTCMRLLLESGLPFMVIEPAKTEYRALYERNSDIEYYAIGREDLTPFRLNPFELVKHEQLAGHVQLLNATLAAVFPMEAAMPYMVEEAIINAYKAKGWDIYSNENYLVDDPWEIGADVWPTFSDMIHELDAVIEAKKLGQEFTEKYRGSLVARFTNLTLGIKGRMLNTRHSLDFDQLLDKKVVIELEEIKDEQDKALLMGLILVRLAESMKHRHRKNNAFQHLTLVEEAHRLLSRVEMGDSGSKKLGVEMFANLLAEVRKYGEGLIIADQIPNKLVSDVMKNTNTKIVHRLFAADDRDTIGDTMSLNDEQKDFLPLLSVGEAIVYSGGWHAPVWVKVQELQSTTEQPIDEALIQQRGVKQLWAQRQVLFPRLSAHGCWNDVLLSDFLRDGIAIINRFLKFKQLHNTAAIKGKIYPILQKNLLHWRDKLGVSDNTLATYCVDLFQDVSIVRYDDEVIQSLVTALTTAMTSLQALEDLLLHGEVANYMNHKLKIDTI